MEHPSVQQGRDFSSKLRDLVFDGRIEAGELYLIRRSGEELDIGPVGGGGAGRGATIVVAAVDSTDGDKAGADVVCTGVDDNLTIQAVFDELLPSGGSKVRLCAGNFWFTNYIAAEHFWIEGSGPGTYINFENADGMPALVPEIDGHVSNMSFNGMGTSQGTAAVGSADIFTADPGGIVETCWFYDCSVALQVNGSKVLNCYFTGLMNAADDWYYGPIDVSYAYYAEVRGNRIDKCKSIFTGDLADNTQPIGINTNAQSVVVNNVIIGDNYTFGSNDQADWDSAMGYAVQASSDCIVSGNIISGTLFAYAGIYVSDRSVVENNDFDYNCALTAIDGTFQAYIDSYGEGIKVKGNTIYNYSNTTNTGDPDIYAFFFPTAGILVDGGYAFQSVSDNYIYMDSTQTGSVGIEVTGYDFGSVIKGNTVRAGGGTDEIGIHLNSDSIGNVVDLNLSDMADLVQDDGTSNYVGPGNMHNNIVP